MLSCQARSCTMMARMGLQTSILPAVALATCISGELWLGIDGHRPEVALYQLTLAQRGYDPGDIDGYFGPRTQYAATSESLENGGDDELFPDDGVVMRPAFVRLGIAC